MIRWLRQVFFTVFFVGPLAIVCVVSLPGFEFVKWLFGFSAGVLTSADYLEQMNVFRQNMACFCLGGLAILYGIARALAFHPCFNTEYCLWLVRTPFTGYEPLPGGPAHLVWKDAIVIVALAGLGTLYGISPFTVVVCATTPYIVLLAVTMHEVKNKAAAYFVCCGVPLLWSLGSHEILHWFVPVALYAVIRYKMPHGLRFYVDLSARPPDGDGLEVSEAFRQANAILSNAAKPLALVPSEDTLARSIWPYNRLTPRYVVRIPRVDAIFIPIVLTLWVGSALWLIPPEEYLTPDISMAPWVICFILSAILSLGRYASYMTGFASPISVLGRIVTGRWIIPDFDRVFVVPILAVVVALLATTALAMVRIHPAFLYTVPPGVALFMLMNLGPSLNTWRLTGAHRLTPSMLAKLDVGYEV